MVTDWYSIGSRYSAAVRGGYQTTSASARTTVPPCGPAASVASSVVLGSMARRRPSERVGDGQVEVSAALAASSRASAADRVSRPDVSLQEAGRGTERLRQPVRLVPRRCDIGTADQRGAHCDRRYCGHGVNSLTTHRLPPEASGGRLSGQGRA